MRILMISKACIVGIYQRKLEAIARLGVELLALVPPSWRDERGEMKLERVYTGGYRLEEIPIRFNGSFHLHYYPGVEQVWRDKGYTGPLAVIPQFGTDPDLFAPAPQRPERPFTIGYFGRLVEEKGVDVLLNAVSHLHGDWRLILLGGGPMRDALAAQ